MIYLVNKDLLDLLDKYEGDLGLLDERWASKDDREMFRAEQTRTLGDYVDTLRLLKTNNISQELRTKTEKKIRELEIHIAPEVVDALRKRNLSQPKKTEPAG